VARARAWDDEQERHAQEQFAREAGAARRRWAGCLAALQGKGMQALMKLPPEEMGPREILAFIVSSIEGEERVRGMAQGRKPDGGGAGGEPKGLSQDEVMSRHGEIMQRAAARREAARKAAEVTGQMPTGEPPPPGAGSDPPPPPADSAPPAEPGVV
jgi:hypothetical protein